MGWFKKDLKRNLKGNLVQLTHKIINTNNDEIPNLEEFNQGFPILCFSIS